MAQFSLKLHSFFLILFVAACSQNSGAPLRAEPVENEGLESNSNFEEGVPPPRAIPVEEGDFQLLADTIVGRDSSSGVYAQWKKGGRGFYNPSNRALYARFAQKYLTRAYEETRTVYYPFGGPDVIYPLSFFPKTTTLVLVGMEPIGVLPSLEVAQSEEYQASMNEMMGTYLGSSFYVTKDMKAEAKSFADRATWAKMMAAIALLDLKILNTETGTLNSAGVWVADSQLARENRDPLSPKGIVFHCLRSLENKNEVVSIFYFYQNLGDSDWDKDLGLRKASPFINFISSLEGRYTSFLKAASYLSHNTSAFSISNNLVFGGEMIVQAPSGLPFSEFTKRRNGWRLSLFGEYREPSESFKEHSQSDLREAYASSMRGERDGTYSDFVNYGGRLPFHYDYGTGLDGTGIGSMMFFATKGTAFPTKEELPSAQKPDLRPRTQKVVPAPVAKPVQENRPNLIRRIFKRDKR